MTPLSAQEIGNRLDGRMVALRFGSGLALHTLEATARESFEVQAVRPPGVILHCFLDGRTDARLSGRAMGLGRSGGAAPRLVLTATQEPEPFRRCSRAGDYVRKVNIRMDPDWMAARGLVLPAGTRRRSLPLGPGEVADFERLLRLSQGAGPVDRLEAEALALMLVARGFARLCPGADPVPPARAPHDRQRLARMEALIHDTTRPLPGLEEIAREGGVSLSTLRRLFRQTHGCTVQAHVRQVRLEAARRALRAEAVPVAEAARIAGYGSAANFATAYRRAYGEPPSASRRPPRPAPARD
ncbi:helix-turn-helix domain-containing protein [Mangrovicoccus algicola]|uniref:Helix-turn-helix transcriptional regulator n=1 Tax=Mangrovicoccus algicola TaxID=2771008 RepID=A0A8J7CJ70_9RHOB|nr:AraC family transcriptional regulator [Mangrovicoccus algicola]MBE3640455.1 helix-turn-helix transcriptional regulator [Mangrovicoccus algicola]